MKTNYFESAYREWLGERIMGGVGFLDGEDKGLWALNTMSLEKLYVALCKNDPAKAFEKEGK